MTSPTPIATQPDAWPQAESETVEFKTSMADGDRQMSARELETLILKRNSAALRRGNVSHRRNPLIADLFRRIEMVEAWGRGMPLILQNAPDVEFREIARLFVASFERPSATVETTQETVVTGLETSPQTDATTPEKPVTTLEVGAETPRKHQENTKERLLQLLREQPHLSTPAMALVLGIGVDGTKYHLTRLKQAGQVRHVGPTKGGHWQVTEPDTQGTI